MIPLYIRYTCGFYGIMLDSIHPATNFIVSVCVCVCVCVCECVICVCCVGHYIL